jgi:hypothetical protein
MHLWTKCSYCYHCWCTMLLLLLLQLLVLLLSSLTNSMDLSPSWEAATRSATLEFSQILWNPKVHRHIHKSPPLVPTLRQMNRVHTSSSCLSKINLNIIPHLYLGLPSGRFPSGVPTKYCIIVLLIPEGAVSHRESFTCTKIFPAYPCIFELSRNLDLSTN